ncbi:Eco57I restriction-modification methylase domain-containing protein [Nocardiopsis sp. SBT366]|uniref:Eco57I restriction-modification methylase domain-containing protein n=1 Tax=Nocardiopsis sp. SBT366 TaxID=1580529 RepID=UPI00066BA016|nr:DNA methyltransferase [Nocardiopsis sp. SBT366]
MPGTRRRIPSVSPAEQHAEWIGLLAPDGPFLSAEVLTEAFASGLPTVDAELRKRLRQGWEELEGSQGALAAEWITLVLGEVLRWGDKYRVQSVTEGGGTRPEFALVGPKDRDGRAERLHFYRLPWGTNPVESGADRPSPVEAAAARSRESGVPLSLVTDGQWWALVHARPSVPTSVGVFDADLWLEEPLLFQAFTALLEGKRVQVPATSKDGKSASDSTAALFARTFEKQSDLTDDLGKQVRQAVELLVAEIARIDRGSSGRSSGRFLEHVGEREVYKGALTVLMRLVFLLYAEEQRLLPTDDLYAEHYSVTRLHDQLADDRNRLGEEVGDRRAAAWPRLLALFAGIHCGAEHPDLRLPAYGGSLFAPSRYPWLAEFAIADRVVFEVLDALVMLKPRKKSGTPTRISYKGLGVEDIGHIYEGLLEFSVRRVDEPYVGLGGKLEPEVALAELEEQYSEGEAVFFDWLKEETGATAKQLQKMLKEQPEAAQRAGLGSAWDNHEDLAERTLPFWGLLRQDLREEPTVFPTDSVLFTQVGERRKTGTHYTPRELAEKVVRHTLEPLAFNPGPAEGAAEADWRVKPAEELLGLKVCDPAMGSGAFLVAATRFLADRVLEAWQRDGIPGEVLEALGSGYELDDVRLFAKRRVAASCVYGVDRDDMAVELAKLSMWLETLAKNKPFSFLDHALVCGDSLVGLVNEEQVRAFHTDPKRGRYINARLTGDVGEYIDRKLGQARELRREIEALPPVNDPGDVAEREKLLGRANTALRQLRLACDGVVAAALAAERYAELDLEDYEKKLQDGEAKKLNWQDAYDDLLTRLSDEIQALLDEDGEGYDFYAEQATESKIWDWLTGNRADPIRPLHWALEFPEVMGEGGQGGFDAVVGNPPFIGGKRLTGAVGVDVREYLVVDIAKGKRGHADLCSYFLLRNLAIAPKGRTGIIATNTIAQGDTREVGLDQVVTRDWTIYRAVKSQVWPGSANVHVSLVWAGHAGKQEQCILGEGPVPGITPSLEPRSRAVGNPWRLVANADQSFIGAYPMGDGFVLDSEAAAGLIRQDPKNSSVVMPFINGKDLNSRPDCSPSRWVINFGSMAEDEARNYPAPFAVVERDVKPGRLFQKDAYGQKYWWQFFRVRPEMRAAISGLKSVLVIALTSKTVVPVLVSSGQVFSHALGVFASSRMELLGLLSSSFHYSWAVARASSMKGDLRYTPSDVYETFPKPERTKSLTVVGECLDRDRREIMLRRELGLTKLYNLVHDPACQGDVDVDRIREIHVEVDEAVKEAYDWSDLDLELGHHETDQGPRWTVSPTVRVEILDRLLELNHARHDEEERKGIWPPKKKRKAAKSKATPAPDLGDGLFPPEGTLF